MDIKQLVAELSLEVRKMKKTTMGTVIKTKYMHCSQSEKYEIIRIVEQSEPGVSLELLGINTLKNKRAKKGQKPPI